MGRPKQVEDQFTGLTVGSLVRYYDDGWRYGHLEEVKKGIAIVRPIVSKYAATPRCAKVPAVDVQIEKEKL
jgi:hypothetical protein